MTSPGVLALLRGRTDELAALLDADPTWYSAVTRELDCGPSSGRDQPARRNPSPRRRRIRFSRCVRLLLDRGADVNARANIDANGVGGQTAIFHALAHFNGTNPEITQLLIDHGADLTIRARVPAQGGALLDVSAAE